MEQYNTCMLIRYCEIIDITSTGIIFTPSLRDADLIFIWRLDFYYHTIIFNATMSLQFYLVVSAEPNTLNI